MHFQHLVQAMTQTLPFLKIETTNYSNLTLNHLLLTMGSTYHRCDVSGSYPDHPKCPHFVRTFLELFFFFRRRRLANGQKPPSEEEPVRNTSVQKAN